MDIPGRKELQKTYEGLADEVLIGIARNVNREYEDMAAETAGTVLAQRGVDIPVPDEKPAECAYENGISSCHASSQLTRPNEKLAGPLVEIPKFSGDESREIEEIFVKGNVPYEIHPVSGASCSSCRGDEYAFHLPEESFDTAIHLLKEYYAQMVKDSSSSYFSGECPACGTALTDKKACTDCGLVLTVDYAKSLETHPFMEFLKRNNL